MRSHTLKWKRGYSTYSLGNDSGSDLTCSHFNWPGRSRHPTCQSNIAQDVLLLPDILRQKFCFLLVSDSLLLVPSAAITDISNRRCSRLISCEIHLSVPQRTLSASCCHSGENTGRTISSLLLSYISAKMIETLFLLIYAFSFLRIWVDIKIHNTPNSFLSLDPSLSCCLH